MRLSVSVGLILLVPLLSCSDKPSITDEQIQTRIRTILELPSVEYRYKEIVYLGEQKSFLFIPTSQKEVLFSVEIRVQAGYDLQRSFGLKRDRRNPRNITLGLPPPQILLIDVDESTLHQYFVVERGERFRRFAYTKELDIAKERIRQDAINRGILREAEQNAKMTIQGLLTMAGFEEVHFKPDSKEDP